MRKCDVGVEEQISKLVDEVLHGFGKLDILVNLVGGFWGGKPSPRPRWPMAIDVRP